MIKVLLTFGLLYSAPVFGNTDQDYDKAWQEYETAEQAMENTTEWQEYYKTRQVLKNTKEWKAVMKAWLAVESTYNKTNQDYIKVKLAYEKAWEALEVITEWQNYDTARQALKNTEEWQAKEKAWQAVEKVDGAVNIISNKWNTALEMVKGKCKAIFSKKL